MKKKINPQHYLTDALITSDEWDNFDYNLQLQIKSLGHIDYDSKPINWKKNWLGYGYLLYVEELLREKYKGENRKFKDIHDVQTLIKKHTYLKTIIKDIRELQTLIEKYDNLKVCLLTLRIATIAYRSGLIPEFVTYGENFRKDQSKKGGKLRGRGGKTAAELQARNNQIIEHFKKARLKNPRLTASAFAQKYAANDSLKSRRIRALLKMAVGN